MKKYPIHNPHFIYLEESFTRWLDIMGYSPSAIYCLPRHVQELMHYLEQTGVNHIRQLTVNNIRNHYDQLKQRENQVHGGGLSNAYLNKHLQAIYKFSEYLRKSGRLLLPAIGIDWEPDDSQEIAVLTVQEIGLLYKATYGYHEGTLLEPFGARDRAILTIYYGCGLRRNEGYHLNLSDVNFDRRILRVRKGKNYKERLVPFN